MKKSLISCLICVTSMAAHADTFNITVGNVTYSAPTDLCGDMTYTGGTTLSALGKDYDLSQINLMTVDDRQVDEKTVTIIYQGSTASVSVDAQIASYIDITVDGAAVTISQHDDITADNCGEITYILKGYSDNGSFYMAGAYKATLVLDGVNLTNTSGAAIDIQNGKRIKFKIADGTSNQLTDGISGTQKGCIVCKGHIEFQGSGSLDVTGNTAHAIYAKEYVTLKNASINVKSAVKDGLNCNQYFEMKSGTLHISGVGDDGLQVSFKDDVDREVDDTGSITISGGLIEASSTAIAAKAIKADGDITVTGGEIIASASGVGKWDTTAMKTKAASCLSADGNMSITGGNITLTATGAGGKGINVDGELTISGGTLDISTTGGIYAYVNGKEYTNYTGNTDNLNSDYKSSPKGIKADGNVIIDNGNITIKTTGNGAEGIESKSVMTINGGTIDIHSNDDGLNSSSHMYIKGGDITVVATSNDAIDSNGNLYIEGGYIRAFGASSPECGIDANEEEGYTVIFTGGTLIAVGGNNSTPSNSTSTQPYVSGNMSVSAGNTVSLKSGSEIIASFEVPTNYTGTSTGGGGGGFGPGGFGGNSGSKVLVTCPALTSGSSYTLTSGNSSTSVKAQLTGSNGNRPW